MRRNLLMFSLVFMLGACASSTDDAAPPTVQLTNLQLGSISLLSQELLLDLKVGNPNDFSLPLDGLTFKLEVNGSPFAEGFSDQRVEVPRLGYATVGVTASVGTMSMVNQLMSLGQSDKVDYSISGVAYFGRMGVRRSVPFERAGSLSLMQGLNRRAPGAPDASPPPPDEMRTLVPL